MVTAELGVCEWFVYELRRSNLIERSQIDQVVGEYLKRHPRAEPPELAEYLGEQGILSKYQAERVLRNKAQGLVLGPYVLVDAIGSGSMGTVYKAQSKTDNLSYAVKVLPRRSMWNVRLARRQVRSFGQFSHPAVVPFVDVGTSGGMHYLVWPLVEGEPLENLVQRLGKLSSEQTAQIGLQIAGGLTACHTHGLFHGLLKPSNVMVSPEFHVSILDIGIGSLLVENEGESLVDTMSTANTLTSGLDCASPESIMEPTNRTPAGDQYSLGCLLYYCLAGRYPFPEGSAVEKMMAHQFKQATAIKELAPEVPDPLVKVIERLMQKAPDARYRGADEIVEELQPIAARFERPQPVAAPGPRPEASAPAPNHSPDPTAAGTERREMQPPRHQAAPRPTPEQARQRPLASPASAAAYPAPAAYPQAPAYPPPQRYPAAVVNPYAPPPVPAPPVAPAVPAAAPAGSSSASLNFKMPSRKDLGANGGSGSLPGYMMPPGFIDESAANRPLSPMIFAAVGMSVMIVAYVALTALSAFR